MATQSEPTSSTEWTYPTRMCRICREDVVPTVTMYPPGLPMQFQTPVVEYKNDDEYGRLMKPCLCRGSARYIHELCLLRSRTEVARRDVLWQCPTCGYKFNFARIKFQKLLSNKFSVAMFTALFMVVVIFLLGFVADPIINIYLDPYDTLRGKESLWSGLEVESRSGPVSSWGQHFAKGTISMGLVGFIKTVLLNPLNWLNIRFNTFWGGSTRTTRTGRDRAADISWIAVVIGISTAFVFFYKWMEVVVERALRKIGNNIVDTQLPGDDDDLKPPPGWKYPVPMPPPTETSDEVDETTESTSAAAVEDELDIPIMSGSWMDVSAEQSANSIPIKDAHRQGWSFADL